MNTDNNQRYRDTEDRIQHAYWKLVSNKEPHKVTVADICREAKIHRTTFYGHYLDIYDLQEQAMKKHFMSFMHGFFNEDGKWNFRDGMQKLIDFYYRNKKIIKHHLDMIEKHERHEYVFDIRIDSEMAKAYQKIFQLKNEKEVSYHQVFFQNGLEAVIKQWVRNDCQEPPEEITDLLCRIFRV